jgi:ribonucleoside-diphosphate reductase alpha chain
MYGPRTMYSEELHSAKYRADGETFDDYCVRYARIAADDEFHFRHLLDGLRHQRILPAGRQQLAVGRPYDITAMNCYVGGTIPDTSEGIMDELKYSMLTLRSGGGCGWDFSTLRPYGDPIRGLGIKAYSTGPVSFMECWDSMCNTVLSAGHRRGAMMGVLRVDHPDIMRFINAKARDNYLTNFNISVAITDVFMDALKKGDTYNLVFNDKVYETVRAADVWARIMERNWDWADPGVLFIDRINEMNPLAYCEAIAATNPCGEQPLPPNGACLLGSLNLVQYLIRMPLRAIGEENNNKSGYEFDWNLFKLDAATTCRAFDNVIDNTRYPLSCQREEALNKRRMGIGITGTANTLETLGFRYASQEYIKFQSRILETLRDVLYNTSCNAAKVYGSFPSFVAEKWLASGYAKTLPKYIQDKIRRQGLRNGLLLSIAPTGTISMCADNVSSGIEPPYSLKQKRLVHMPEGQVEMELVDYAYAFNSVKGRTTYEISGSDHVKVLCAAQKYIDSAVSKTCNVAGVEGDSKRKKGQITYNEFKNLYLQAYRDGAKGCTTFNLNGKKFGILAVDSDENAACRIDPITGATSCEA